MSNIKALQNIPEVSFIDNLTLEEVREEMFGDVTARYEELAGQSVELSAERRAEVLSFTSMIYQTLQRVDWAGKQNLLKYSVGAPLDNLAAYKGVLRKPASYASAHLQFAIQNARTSATGIPAGTRVSNLAGVYFMTTTYAEIPAGEMSVVIPAVALEAGATANDLPVGSINQIVDPVPYVYAVTNTTETSGGSDVEDDDQLTERVYLAPGSYSTAGSEAAYIYHAKNFRADVSHVSVFSNQPSSVIVMFLLDGELPGGHDIEAMEQYLSKKTVRPLADHVSVVPPDEVGYNIQLTYYIDRSNNANAAQIQTAVTQAIAEYKTWQREIGRDINPSQLIRKIMEAGAKRVELVEPTYTAVCEHEVSRVDAEAVIYGGMEEG